jgi:hypothetical protein
MRYTDCRPLGSKVSRGVRNNNPGNVKNTAPFLGEAQIQQDKTFITFLDMRYGIRAAALVVLNIVQNHGGDTIRKLISVYAPSNENNTKSYIANICKWTGQKPDDKIILTRNNFFNLLRAIFEEENDANSLKNIKIYDLKAGINEAFDYKKLDLKNKPKTNEITQNDAASITTLIIAALTLIFLIKI